MQQTDHGLLLRRAAVIGDGAVLDEQARKVRQLRPAKETNRYQNAWRRYTAAGQLTMVAQMSLESALKVEFPTLLATNAEKFYQMLLERAGVPLS